MAKSEGRWVQKNIRFPEELWERLEAVTNERERSAFIRAAIEEKLEPLEVRKRLEVLEKRVSSGG